MKDAKLNKDSVVPDGFPVATADEGEAQPTMLAPPIRTDVTAEAVAEQNEEVTEAQEAKEEVTEAQEATEETDDKEAGDEDDGIEDNDGGSSIEEDV